MLHERLSQELIVEAILDVRVSEEHPLPVERLEPFMSSLEGYSRVEKAETTIEDGEDGERDLDGFVAFADDEEQAVQVRQVGFFYHRFSPYPGWDLFRSEAQSLWSRFSEAIEEPKAISIGLRYLNRLEREIDSTGERRILEVWPWPDESVLTRRPSRYFMRIDAPTDIKGIDAEVAHAFEVTDDSENILLIIDNSVRSAYPEDDDVWGRFEEMHEVAYRLFRDAFTRSFYESLL